MENEEKKSAKKSVSKIDDLSVNTENRVNQLLKCIQVLKMNGNNNSIRSKEICAKLLEDFNLRKNITYFDYECL
ncbi:MAG TPA: hypothetical protein VLM44_12730 [Lutibacter sp.]|nr:hypothetical protein [Lutibacter sp.]